MYYEEWELEENYNKYIDEYLSIRDELFEYKVGERQEEINLLCHFKIIQEC